MSDMTDTRGFLTYTRFMRWRRGANRGARSEAGAIVRVGLFWWEVVQAERTRIRSVKFVRSSQLDLARWLYAGNADRGERSCRVAKPGWAE